MQQGAWRRGTPRSVRLADAGLQIDDYIFFPTSEEDVFIRMDGKQEIYFGRDAKGAISFFVTSFGPSAFERIAD